MSPPPDEPVPAARGAESGDATAPADAVADPRRAERGLRRRFWRTITVAGGMPGALLLCLPALGFGVRPALVALAAVTAVFAVANFVKALYFRPRPDNPAGLRPHAPLVRVRHYVPGLTPPRDAARNALHAFRFVDAGSFPSVHSARAFALALAYAPLVGDDRAVAGLFGAAGLVAWSRVYLRRHHVSDTIAGAVLGLVVTWVVNATVPA